MVMDAQALMDVLDEDKNGTVSWVEFRDHFAREETRGMEAALGGDAIVSSLRRVFNKLAGRDGVVSRAELFKALRADASVARLFDVKVPSQRSSVPLNASYGEIFDALDAGDEKSSSVTWSEFVQFFYRAAIARKQHDVLGADARVVEIKEGTTLLLFLLAFLLSRGLACLLSLLSLLSLTHTLIQFSIVHHNPQNTKTRYMTAFDFCDRDGNGRVSRSEFMQVVRQKPRVQELLNVRPAASEGIRSIQTYGEIFDYIDASNGGAADATLDWVRVFLRVVYI
jgi:Ca2+-binding EF-hand superfamily protein